MAGKLGAAHFKILMKTRISSRDHSRSNELRAWRPNQDQRGMVSLAVTQEGDVPTSACVHHSLTRASRGTIVLFGGRASPKRVFAHTFIGRVRSSFYTLCNSCSQGMCPTEMKCVSPGRGIKALLRIRLRAIVMRHVRSETSLFLSLVAEIQRGLVFPRCMSLTPQPCSGVPSPCRHRILRGWLFTPTR